MSDSCCVCSSTVGPENKVQPTNCDGQVFCPRCFVTRRMAAEPDRFNATQSCAAFCHHCGWTAISHGALPESGALRCGHCGHFTALRVKLEELPLTDKERANIEEMARAAGVKNPKRIASSK